VHALANGKPSCSVCRTPQTARAAQKSLHTLLYGRIHRRHTLQTHIPHPWDGEPGIVPRGMFRPHSTPQPWYVVIA
jgi:hypothetical protein